LRDEDSSKLQNIDKCSSNAVCYVEGEGGGYLNSNCNARESCGKYNVEVIEKNEEGRDMAREELKNGCILSKYCPETETYESTGMVKSLFLD
jgi:uncharacterized 2Fe-2S/4Fe-4S cluster protein (DUF4445 family)